MNSSMISDNDRGGASNPSNPSKVAAVCGTCRFWNRLSDANGIFTDAGYDDISEGTGQCRFNPPSAAQVNPFYATDRPITSSDAALAALWPVTFDEHWCGQHRPRVALVED